MTEKDMLDKIENLEKLILLHEHTIRELTRIIKTIAETQNRNLNSFEKVLDKLKDKKII